MKVRSFLTAAVLVGSILAARPSRAQSTPDQSDAQNELYANLGVFTVQEIASIFGSVIDQVLRNAFGDEMYTESDDSTGAIAIGYNRYLTPRWTVGAISNFV